MGQSHYTSNIIGKNSSYIASFASITATDVTVGGTLTAGTISGTTLASANIQATGNYIKMGNHQYIFFGRIPNTAAAVVANATAVDASNVGSMTINFNATKGNIWYHVSDTSASIAGAVA